MLLSCHIMLSASVRESAVSLKSLSLIVVFSSRRRHTRFDCDWSSDVCSSDLVGRADVVRLLDLLANGLEAIKNGSEPRTQLELALVKAAAPDVDASTRALLARVERLEAQLAHGANDDEARSVRAVGQPLPDAPTSPPAPPVEGAAP